MGRRKFFRLLVATVIGIVSIAAAFIGYFAIVYPLEYTVDTLGDAYVNISDELNYSDAEETKNTLNMFPFFLAGTLIVFIAFILIWWYNIAHDDEHEEV